VNLDKWSIQSYEEEHQEWPLSLRKNKLAVCQITKCAGLLKKNPPLTQSFKEINTPPTPLHTYIRTLVPIFKTSLAGASLTYGSIYTYVAIIVPFWIVCYTHPCIPQLPEFFSFPVLPQESCKDPSSWYATFPNPLLLAILLSEDRVVYFSIFLRLVHSINQNPNQTKHLLCFCT